MIFVIPFSSIRLGFAPVRIDLMSNIKGCADFSSAWKSVPAHYLGLDDLIAAKIAADRPQRARDRLRTEALFQPLEHLVWETLEKANGWIGLSEIY